MKKKSILILLIIMILAIFGIMAYESINQNQVSIGNAKFNIPEGYHKGLNNDAGDVNLSNGYNSIFIAEYDNDNVNKYILEISDFIKKQNRTPYITNFTVDEILIHKLTIVNDTQYYRYWFVDNNITYCIYTWDGNSNMDNLAYTLIKSAKL